MCVTSGIDRGGGIYMAEVDQIEGWIRYCEKFKDKVVQWSQIQGRSRLFTQDNTLTKNLYL